MNESVLMPRIGVNDDFVTIGEWMVKDKSVVKKDQVIASLETSKETFALKAGYDGIIYLLFKEGDEVEVGTEIARINSDTNGEDYKNLTSNENKVADNRNYTKKAKELLEKHPEISIEQLPKDGIIKERDILNLISEPYQIEKTMTNHILINGRGGFLKYAIDIINQTRAYVLDGIIEFHYPEKQEIYGVPVIGNDDDLKKYYDMGYHKIFNAVVFRNNQLYRKIPYENLKKIGYEVVNLVDRTAQVSESVRMGEGNLICPNAYVGSDVLIGNNIVINVGAVVSHDCIISDHCHIASSATLAGCVIVGENTLIGQNCTIYSGVKIGKNVVIMNGCNVFKDVKDNEIVKP